MCIRDSCKHSFCVARARLLLPAAYYLRCRRRKSILQSLLWARPTVCAVGRSAWPFPEKGSAKISAQQVVPLWLPGFFLHNVFPDAVEHVAGVWGRTGLTSGGKAALDDKAAVAVGLSRGNSCSVGGSVFLWLLQHNAHIHRPGNHHYGFL